VPKIFARFWRRLAGTHTSSILNTDWPDGFALVQPSAVRVETWACGHPTIPLAPQKATHWSTHWRCHYCAINSTANTHRRPDGYRRPLSLQSAFPPHVSLPLPVLGFDWIASAIDTLWLGAHRFSPLALAGHSLRCSFSDCLHSCAQIVDDKFTDSFIF
jgi:hypothetical protein